MTKRKWERIEQPELPPTEDGLNSPFFPNQQAGVCPKGSLPVGHLAYVGEPGQSDEVAFDATSAAKEGRKFQALLGPVGPGRLHGLGSERVG